MMAYHEGESIKNTTETDVTNQPSTKALGKNVDKYWKHANPKSHGNTLPGLAVICIANWKMNFAIMGRVHGWWGRPMMISVLVINQRLHFLILNIYLMSSDDNDNILQ